MIIGQVMLTSNANFFLLKCECKIDCSDQKFPLGIFFFNFQLKSKIETILIRRKLLSWTA